MTAATGAWAQDETYPIVYDFEAAANAGENPENKNGSAANGQAFYGWERSDRTDSKRQDYKGYGYTDGSVLPKVCHVWRRSDRINGNVAGNGGLKCPSDKEMAVDGLTEGLTVTIIYDATNATNKEIVWAIGDGSSEGGPGSPRATATINGVEAVPGETTIKSGDVIIVNSVTPADNGSGYIVFKVMKGMVIKKITISTSLALNEEDDNSAKLTELDGHEADVTLTRTLKAGSWNTFAVPFNVDATKLAALKLAKGVTVKELTSTSFDAGTLTLNFADATSIEAGKPYLVKVTSDFNLSTNTFPGAIVSKTAVPFTSDAVDFIPTLGKTTIPAGDTKTILFLASGNQLKNPTELPADMKGFRAYFQLKGDAVSAASFNIDFGDGETTGINAVNGEGFTVNGSVYNLAGQRVAQPTKGLYILNGKKVIIK